MDEAIAEMFRSFSCTLDEIKRAVSVLEGNSIEVTLSGSLVEKKSEQGPLDPVESAIEAGKAAERRATRARVEADASMRAAEKARQVSVWAFGQMEAQINRLKEENAALKERLRSRDPETELPPDNQFVIILERPAAGYKGTTLPAFRAASHYLGKWVTTSGWAAYPVAWWPLPEQQKRDQ